MKYFCRVMLCNYLFAVIVSMYVTYSVAKPFSEMSATDWMFGAWVIISLICLIIFWVYMFYHWGTTCFRSARLKKVWFIVILIGGPIYLIGPIAYYIAVYEMKMGRP